MVEQFFVVRIRGTHGVRSVVERALKQMHLTRKNHCILLDASPAIKGTLQFCRDYIAWGEADAKTIEKISAKKGGQTVYRLNPPRGGFKGGIKNHFPNGALGFQGEKINALIESML